MVTWSNLTNVYLANKSISWPPALKNLVSWWWVYNILILYNILYNILIYGIKALFIASLTEISLVDSYLELRQHTSSVLTKPAGCNFRPTAASLFHVLITGAKDASYSKYIVYRSDHLNCRHQNNIASADFMFYWYVHVFTILLSEWAVFKKNNLSSVYIIRGLLMFCTWLVWSRVIG